MDRAHTDPRLVGNESCIRSVISPYYGTVTTDFLMAGETHECPYLPARDAREEFFLAERFPPELYHDFMNHGFRRSGRIIYRPICQGCCECRPIRISAEAFVPNKSHRRILRKNEDMEIRVGVPRFSRDKFKIYCDYLVLKHDTLPDKSPAYLKDSLYISPVSTIEFEYRLGRRLVGVGIADLCSRSMSSVYMFYDPDCFSRSLGTFSAVQELFFCKGHSIPHYYLGFYVRECSSMNYKERFQPHEILDCCGSWIARPPRKTKTLVESTLASRQQSGADWGKD